ncbi:hypothetical protein [Streptomyces agglomeratus]|uniref:hypothetical protein n=1 Tax=Streptomyces agglomeratus TaxID=285458 RepID=UPI001F0AE057|nr:hypothetical protein [Streptomyces agglomeratus]
MSGARVGEVLNLRRGCIKHDKNANLWLMEGLYFKGAEDENGNKIPEGQPREDPWVVLEIVARAVTVLERLHPHPLLFPPESNRTGDARRAKSDWVTHDETSRSPVTWQPS